MRIRMMLVVFLLLGFLLIISYYLLSSAINGQFNSKVKGTEVISTIKKPSPTSTFIPLPTPSPTPFSTPTPTATPTLQPVIMLPQDLEELFNEYGSIYNIDKELLKKIAKCESSLNPNAKNNDYAGLFQFETPLWLQTRTLMGENTDLNLRFNPEEAIQTAAFMISQNRLGIWPNCHK